MERHCHALMLISTAIGDVQQGAEVSSGHIFVQPACKTVNLNLHGHEDPLAEVIFLQLKASTRSNGVGWCVWSGASTACAAL